MRFLKFFLALLGVLLLYLLFWPVPIDPVAWTPPPPPALDGPYAQNEHLAAITRLETRPGFGPEDVAVDAQGRIYGGLQNGHIVRFDPEGTTHERFVDTAGRPLGLAFDSLGHLIVADSHKGLLSISPDAEITVLTTEADGVPFGFTDDVDIAKDGTIYFSDASHKFGQIDYRADALEHRPNGRLLAYDPATGTTRTLLNDLYFANGIAVSPDQSFVLVNETWMYRVQRYWLTGPKAGTAEVFIDNLPGFPDGISTGTGGVFWLALASPRNPLMDRLAPSPWLRKVVFRLPQFLQPSPAHYAFALGLDTDGRVVHNLQDPNGSTFYMVTSVEEHNGRLYFGTLEGDAIGYLPRPTDGG